LIVKGKIIPLTVLGIVAVSVALGGLYMLSDVTPEILANYNPSKNEMVEDKDFVFAFYSEIAKNNEKSNIFFSPLSISSAFSMAYEGADENTASEMQHVFDFESDDSKRQKIISDTMSRLNHKDDWYNLQVANALWIKDGYEIKQDYQNTIKTNYSGTVDNVNFATDDGINKINSWVVEKTNGKIQDILAPGSTDEFTRMVITNAVYFKGKWGSPFGSQNTSEKPFWTDKDTSIDVPMMRKDAAVYSYAETGDLQALELNYLGGDISMVVLLPKDRDGIESLEESMSKSKFDSIKDSMTRQSLTLQIPKFEFETKYNLITPLQNLGLHDAFDKNNADFQGMTDEKVYLEQAAHKAFVNVNEEGTEAAAVTALVIIPTSGPPEPRHEFTADHPFMFVIQEKETGEVLFIGRVMDPTK